MTTLIAVYNSDGCVGRCDAKCYMATGWTTRCTCICGGANHGAGEMRARENMRAGVGFDHQDLLHFAEARDLQASGLVVVNRFDLHADSREAREYAYMLLNQLELPFERVA